MKMKMVSPLWRMGRVLVTEESHPPEGLNQGETVRSIRVGDSNSKSARLRQSLT
jgi:hypothetical protein